MTPRERTLMVLRGEIPDRVPVMPGYGVWYASRVCGGDLFDVQAGLLPAGKIIADITRKYGCDNWYSHGYLDDVVPVWNDGRGASSDSVERTDEDNFIVTHNKRTPLGVITRRVVRNRYSPPYTIEGFIKDPEHDWPIYRDCYGDRWRWEDYSTIREIPPEDLALGITSFNLTLPVDFWKNLRLDTQATLLDLKGCPPEVQEAMEWHGCQSEAKLRARLAIDPLPDMVHLQGSSSSLSLISADIYRRYNIAFINRICELAHARGVPVHVHHCGKSMALVEMLCDATDIDIIHPLEPPPSGDVDLKEVKQRFGRRLVLMGNLNTYPLMLRCTPEEVRAAARRCIDVAAEGGRFILANGDQLGRDTPEENVMAMVEAAHEFGIY